MKERLIVMNGQRIVQSEVGGKWSNQQVEKAGPMRPGIYNLYSAKPVDKSITSQGLIIHSDQTTIYQEVGRQVVAHSKSDFDKSPAVGLDRVISYDATGRAAVSTAQASLKRGRPI
ncbi:MAG: conjugal transfer protein TraO [Burkholderiaceae bacterium]|nr:conjugal transfer protein TraO [Burkholderiaceae bacterium]